MSEIKVNKISPVSDSGTITLGDSGDTFTVPSGATITNSGTATGFGGGGKINQVINVVKTDIAAETTQSTWVDISGLSATITPSATDSKILVLPSVIMTCGNQSFIRIVRNQPAANTIIDDGVGDAAGNRLQCLSGTFGSGQTTYNHQPNTTQIVLDEPATTSAITYQIQWYKDSASNTLLLNQTRTYPDANTTASPRTISSITLMEVLA